MDEFASIIGELEIRRSPTGGRRLRGRFPYNSLAVLSDGGKSGGRPVKERFKPGAFKFSLQSPDQEIHALVGHSFDKPLASKKAGTLTFNDTSEALNFDAEITPQIVDTSYGSDLIKQIEGGMKMGWSPGFRLPPPRAVAKPEVFTDEGHDPARGMHNARIRTILEAVLFELSVLVRPAYSETIVKLDALGNAVDPEIQALLDAGWTISPEGVLVPPPNQPLIKRSHISARYR